MTTKTASIRLDKSKFREIDEKCDSLECSRNDFIKKAIERELSNKSSSATERIDNCTCCDQASKETMKMIIEKLHDHEELSLTEDDFERPTHLEVDWFYEEKYPKIKIEEI